MNSKVLLSILVLTCISLVAQAPAPGGRGGGGRYVEPEPYNFNDHSGGWVSIFDGSTLKGWEGPMEYWRIENGAIVASAKAEERQPSVYLFWAGGDLKNFEFKTEIKLEGQGGNSGVQFRAERLGKTDKKLSEWESRGYQADYDYTNQQTGALIECCAGPRRGVPPRKFRASMGMALRTALSDNDKDTLMGTFGAPEELKKFIHVGDWNELHLIARGTTMMYFLNGHLMSLVVDDNPKMFVDHGELSIQLEGNGDRKVSYRNMWLRKLP
jgi:hypothetical protein